MFAWMRPNDLVWNYVVNNYLLGNDPPAHDILFWNSDTTRLPARLHADFLALYEANAFRARMRCACAGARSMLAKIGMDTYVIGGLTDHITPWQAVYRTARLCGGARSTFVLSNGGHIQSLVNPAGNARSWFMAGRARVASAESWLGRQRRAKAAGGRIGASGSRRGPARRSPRRHRSAAQDIRRSSRPPAPTCSSHDGAANARSCESRAMRFDHARIRGHRIRYAVRRGDPASTPLLILNGIGANIELLAPFVDALPAPPLSPSTFPVSAARRRPRRRIGPRESRASPRACSITSDTRMPTCSACRGAARSRSSSHSNPERAAAGWCWPPRRRAP